MSKITVITSSVENRQIALKIAKKFDCNLLGTPTKSLDKMTFDVSEDKISSFTDFLDMGLIPYQQD